MMEAGQVDEVKKLLPLKGLKALHTVGYTELFDYLKGDLTLDEAIALVVTHTRQYAKRQMTWFRKDPEIKWFEPSPIEDMINYIDKTADNA